jgi:hypothetical protein
VVENQTDQQDQPAPTWYLFVAGASLMAVGRFFASGKAGTSAFFLPSLVFLVGFGLLLIWIALWSNRHR